MADGARGSTHSSAVYLLLTARTYTWPVPIRDVLLRILLCIALIANGATTGVPAHAGHDGMAAPAEVAQSSVSDAGKLPCDEHPRGAEALPSTPADADGAPSDCCASDACRCACMHAGHVALASVVQTAADKPHAAAMRPLSSGHAAPALPHLIRPPIG